jgi:hypothetical protein
MYVGTRLEEEVRHVDQSIHCYAAFVGNGF